jgi:hypothetical protein
VVDGLAANPKRPFGFTEFQDVQYQVAVNGEVAFHEDF